MKPIKNSVLFCDRPGRIALVGGALVIGARAASDVMGWQSGLVAP